LASPCSHSGFCCSRVILTLGIRVYGLGFRAGERRDLRHAPSWMRRRTVFTLPTPASSVSPCALMTAYTLSHTCAYTLTHTCRQRERERERRNDAGHLEPEDAEGTPGVTLGGRDPPLTRPAATSHPHHHLHPPTTHPPQVP
jgi:hypothetical protein